MHPIDMRTIRTLRRGMSGLQEIVFLHALLNQHLGPPDDQLPVHNPGAADFGPRTEAKVKRFQELNRIDVGTAFFRDGVVGPHTWAKLAEVQQATVTVLGDPQFKLTPPTFPSFPGSFPAQPPVAIPVPRLTFDNIQVQAGEQGTLPFGSGGVTVAHSFQAVGVFLNKNDKDEFHPEIQIGPTILFNRGPGASSKTDLGFLAVLNLANLPGSAGRFNWSVQAQLALIKSLSNRSGSVQISGLAGANLSVIRRGSVDVLQLTTQLGIVGEFDPPNDDNGGVWKVSAGAVAFFGLTGTFGSF
jgi:hypothetical protein